MFRIHQNYLGRFLKIQTSKPSRGKPWCSKSRVGREYQHLKKHSLADPDIGSPRFTLWEIEFMSLVLLPFWAPDMVPRDTDKLCWSFLSQGQVWVTPCPDSHPEWNSSRSALQPVYLRRLKLAWAHAAVCPWNQLIFHSTFGHTLAKYWAEWSSCWKHPICQGVCEHLVQCGCPASVACQLPVPQDTQVNQSQTC